ncbi:MAG: hypothetical protein H6978_10490 [Gammaproteobacteria bacterium]|nr:hypothetical protein [Gammaproteobacteria bacterium]
MTDSVRSAVLLVIALASGCAPAPPSAEEQASHPDFSGIWYVAEHDEVIRPNENDPPYTEEALRRLQVFHDNFDTVNESAVTYCNSIGMPWSMLARARDYAREIYQTPDRVFVIFEYMDEFRSIHLDQTGVPDGFFGSKMGYSTAHWDGDELVVETGGYAQSTIATDMQRSDEITTVEHWRLLNHPTYGESLEIEIEINDPRVYTEPRRGRALWKRAPDDTVLNMYGCPATLWEDFVLKRVPDAE